MGIAVIFSILVPVPVPVPLNRFWFLSIPYFDSTKLQKQKPKKCLSTGLENRRKPEWVPGPGSFPFFHFEFPSLIKRQDIVRNRHHQRIPPIPLVDKSIGTLLISPAALKEPPLLTGVHVEEMLW